MDPGSQFTTYSDINPKHYENPDSNPYNAGILYINNGDQGFIPFSNHPECQLALSASFEYLCYESRANIILYSFSARIVFRRQIPALKGLK